MPKFPTMAAYCARPGPITGPMAAIFPWEMGGAQGIDHPVIRDAGHFLQEDAGGALAGHIVEFLRR